MALDLTLRTRRRPGLIGVEKLTISYAFLTTLLLFIFFDRLENPYYLLGQRLAVVLGTMLFWWVYNKKPCRLTLLLRQLLPLALLGFWYPDTHNFSAQLPNIDHLFAQAEQAIFGCQPALTFCRDFNNLFWCEAFNLGYYSYYMMIAFVPIYSFLYKYPRFEKTVFITICAFFLYYVLYLFIPVAGPQYYFQAIGVDQAWAGNFPAIGDWFRYHSELLPTTNHGGPFQWLVESAQAGGERPTAAFPSSHVGMSTILLILAYKNSRKLFRFFVPFYVLLCAATVYIQAHYVIDVIGGWISAFVFYKISHWLYYRRMFHRPRGYRDF